MSFSWKLKINEVVLCMLVSVYVVTFHLSLYDLTRSVGLAQLFCSLINVIGFAKRYVNDNYIIVALLHACFYLTQ